ncbi:uncharacterized protein GLRG_01083 [Colletotrichum graminicola M1.001]|uniref:Uncharacterized protein n=1 Tax=Colletotrichum graminicola (strain M1.001 / M2 / FGSC 10212) TaxID=645133 RepID=E3Q5H2_COLGM|nr:uncharacterized protein GLRG_01083 [Colletotrichum graminicola M1.001]EFQ25939.1 hypothetical protein GLRG_01083 [Colletotrichum graminicola M1.001]
MEPVGLAVGAAGLAGLFSSCLDAVERFDSYKNFGRDWRSLATQFDADKHRFEEWGRAVGFENGRLSDSHHPALDDAQKLAVVRKLLDSIQDFCSDAEDFLYQQYTQSDDGLAKSGLVSSRQIQPRHGAPMASRWRKAAWALTGKTRQTGHVQTFATLVQYLYDVVPPNNASDALSKRPTQLQDSLTAFLDDIRAFMNKVEEEMRAEIKRDLRVWLGCPSTNDLYDDSIHKRLDETCKWILERDEIRDRLSSSASTTKVLWINGPEVEIVSTNHQTPVAHFFLSSKFEGRDDPFIAPRSWVADVAFGNQAALDIVYKRRLAQHEQVATRATLVQLFREVVQTVPFCTFVLDGLDECTWLGESRDGANSVAHFLSELRQAIADTTARIMVTSRNEPEIWHRLSQFPGFNEYLISPKDVHANNVAYSRSIVNNKLSKQDKSTKSNISQRMALRCNGQFQWLKMQEEFLRKGRSRKQLERDLDSAPAGLDRLYDRNWDRIQSLRHEDRKRAFSLLRWAAFSVRPLTVFEMTGAVLVDDDCDDLALDEFPDSVDDDYVDSEILGLCGSLIEVRGSKSPVGWREVHLAHFSVKEYLLFKIPSRGTILLANERLRALNESIESTALAKLRLQYIRFPRVWDNSLAEEKDQIIVLFRNYAANSWFQHTNLNDTKDNALMDAIYAFFDGRDQTWELWRQCFDSNLDGLGPEETETIMPASPLYYASRLGLTGVVKHLLQHCNHDPNEKSNSGRSVLVYECKIGNIEVAQMLLDMGANIDVTGIGGQTALIAASMNGHLDVVKLLLNNGADISDIDDNGYTSLGVASAEGYFEVAELLLNKGASVSSEGINGWTPLYSAVFNGHIPVVKLLLDHGANVTVTDNDGWTPIGLVSYHGHPEVAELLLAHGADVTARNKYSWTPLDVASEGGHTEVVKLLLAHGADVTARNNYGWTPLTVASVRGHTEVVKLLLAHGADVTAVDYIGRTPLHSALRKGHLEVTKLLLAHGIDLEAADSQGWTPLHTTSTNGNVELANFFLERCPGHIKIKDQIGRTCLFLAAMRGRSEIVRLLLSQKASTDIKDLYNATPLIAASRHGHESVVELLLQAENVDLGHKDDFGLTALSWARKSGNARTLQLLLEGSDGEEVQINSEDTVTRKGVVSFHENNAWCDICTFYVPGGKVYYFCEVCPGGDFCICLECYAAGLKCLDSSHNWSLEDMD